MRIDFKRLCDLVIWLAAKADVSNNDVLIITNSDDDMYLRVCNDDTEHILQITGEQVIYRTKKYVEI